MAKGGKPGGGGGGGFTVIGTDGNDSALVLPAGATLLNTTIDGRRGIDTLDLSGYASEGVYVRLQYGMAKAKSLVAEQPFTGVFGNSTLAEATTVSGSIRNVENLIGTTGNDFLFVHTLPGVAKYVDGGAGNDVVNALGGNATLVGGTGSDWLVSYWDGNILVGGADDGDLATSDGVRDFYYLGSAPTILDFEPGIDQLLVELGDGQSPSTVYAPGAAVWVSAGAGSALYVNGVHEVTLANVDLATAQDIGFGVVVSPIDGVVSGGPGDDMLYAGGHTNVTSVVVAPNSGDDVIINFTPSLDTLVLEDGVSPHWSNTIINGAGALVATFVGGSLTFQGLSIDDVGSIMIQGDRGTVSESAGPIESAWSVDSDFAASEQAFPIQSGSHDWLM